MLTRSRVAVVTASACAAAWVGAWAWSPAPPGALRTIPTGASFNLSVARSASAVQARIVAARVEGVELPVFTRSLRRNTWHQVIVGPYVSIDEAEAAQRRLAARGFGAARMIVDESVRRMPGHDGVPRLSPGVDVLLVAAAGRLSVVIEMAWEPRQIVTKRVEDARRGGPLGPPAAVLEVDAGPVRMRVDPQHWSAPAGVTLIDRVSIEEMGPSNNRFLRTRIVLANEARSNVRVAGRRLYIDLWVPEAEMSEAVMARLAGRKGPPYDADYRLAGGEGRADAADYCETIGPAVARLEAIEPFVMSALASPAPEVLAALAHTLGGLEEWMRTIEAPPAWAEAHRMLIVATGLANTAVQRDVTGDRAARAREAFALLNQQATLLQRQLPEVRP